MRNNTCLVAMIFMFFLGATEANGQYCIAPTGDDSNPGTVEAPWATIAHGLSQVGPGDELNIRGGFYAENDLSMSTPGTAGEPITIQAYQNETVIIDGGIPDFLTGQNWQLYDVALDIYRSIGTYTGPYMNAWLNMENHHLITYENYGNFASENYGPVNGFTPIYQGPGILLNSDGFLYIRLVHNPNDLIGPDGEVLVPSPSDTDPNNHEISVFFSDRILTLETTTGHLRFRNLVFQHAENLIDIKTGVPNVEFDSCRFNFGRYGIIVRSGEDLFIHQCEFNGGLPSNIYWTDVKNRISEVAEPYPEFQSAAITSDGPMNGSRITNNIFHHSFDGLTIDDQTTLPVLVEGNLFHDLRDDAINIESGAKTVEVCHNLMRAVGSGISNVGKSEPPAGSNIFIHHNIIDNSYLQHGGRPGNFRSSNWPVWTTINTFGNHGEKFNSSWKIYNNTAVSRISGYSSHSALSYPVPGNPEKYVLNNILFILDHGIALSNDLESDGSSYDGNVYYRPNPGDLPLFADFGDDQDYANLIDFQTYSGTSWCGNSLEVDPILDIAAIMDRSNVVPNQQWYQPQNSLMGSLGVPYDGFSWPAVDGVYYRGALPVENSSGIVSAQIGAVGISNHPNPFNPMTEIQLEVSGCWANEVVQLDIYDVSGVLVHSLFKGRLSEGFHQFVWNGQDKQGRTVASGVYFSKASSGEHTWSQKMLCVR